MPQELKFRLGFKVEYKNRLKLKREKLKLSDSDYKNKLMKKQKKQK